MYYYISFYGFYKTKLVKNFLEKIVCLMCILYLIKEKKMKTLQTKNSYKFVPV